MLIYRCGNIFWRKVFSLLLCNSVRGVAGVVVIFEQFILKRHQCLRQLTLKDNVTYIPSIGNLITKWSRLLDVQSWYLAAEPEVNHENIYEGFSFSWPRSEQRNFLAKLYGFGTAPDWFGESKVNCKLKFSFCTLRSHAGEKIYN